MSNDRSTDSPQWLQYEAGRPEGIEATVSLLVEEVVRLKHLFELLRLGDGDEKSGGGKQGNGDKPTPRGDNAEKPDTDDSLDAKNFKAKVRAVRTDANGTYQWTKLEALEDIDDPKIGKGGLFNLHNKNWEGEFKRAQSAGKTVCLRISGGKVQAIEVLD